MTNSSANTIRPASNQPSMESDTTQFASSRPEFQQGVCDVLLFTARARQSLVTVRSLGKRGIRTAALETPDCAVIPTFASRWCHQRIICPAYKETQEHMHYLHQLLQANGARVVIPISDSDVALLRMYREHGEVQSKLAIAKEPALAIAVSKEQTLAVAKRLGLRIPRGVMLDSLDKVEEALREIGLPAVVKPDESWLENGQRGIRVASHLVTTPDEARRAVEALTSLGGKVVLQQYLPGKREAVSFLYAQGQMHARFAQWAKRTHPPLGGTSILRQSIAMPVDIGEQAERLVREIELEGYSEVEFRRDTAGYPYLMEINPRLSASVEIAVRSGIDFPYLLYQWASGERIETVGGYRSGLWMRYLGGDLATTLEALQQRGRPGIPSPAKAIFSFCSSFFMPARYDYFDWGDLGPAWAACTGAHRNMWKRIKTNLTKGEKAP